MSRAIDVTRQAAKQKKADRRAAAVEGATPALSKESQVAFDLQQYRQIGAITRGKLTKRTKAIISIGSFLAFAAVLGWTFSAGRDGKPDHRAHHS